MDPSDITAAVATALPADPVTAIADVIAAGLTLGLTYEQLQASPAFVTATTNQNMQDVQDAFNKALQAKNLLAVQEGMANAENP